MIPILGLDSNRRDSPISTFCRAGVKLTDHDFSVHGFRRAAVSQRSCQGIPGLRKYHEFDAKISFVMPNPKVRRYLIANTAVGCMPDIAQFLLIGVSLYLIIFKIDHQKISSKWMPALLPSAHYTFFLRADFFTKQARSKNPKTYFTCRFGNVRGRYNMLYY